MQKPYKSVQVFKNPILERLTHVHPITPLVIWLPVALLMLWYSIEVDQVSFPAILGVGAIAFFLWTFVEYILHRFIFHFEGESLLSQRLHFLIHGLHHADPADPTRLVMPPAAGVIFALIFYSLFRFFMGPIWAKPFFTFFLVGYLCYDYIHFAVHHFTPRTRLGKYLKQSHMLHHYADPNSRWGVSSPIWDYVFGTLESAKNGVKSKKQAV